MKKICLFALLVMLIIPMSTGYSQESPSNLTEDTAQLEQLELDLQTKRKEATVLIYGNYYQAEELDLDISEIMPTGNERVTLIERGILTGGDNSPAAYWLIQVENISESFIPSYSVLNYLTVQEKTSAAIISTTVRISHLDSQLMHERPLEELDLTDRYAPGSIQHFRLLVPLENPFGQYQLVSQLQDDTFISEVFKDINGNREIMIILEQPDINFDEFDISEQMETLLTEINTLEAELEDAKSDYYNNLEMDPTRLKFEELDIPLDSLSPEIAVELVIVQHGMELNEEDALEAFWILKTINTSSDFQYATKGLWSLTAHQGLSGMSDYLLPYSVQQVEASSNGFFYPLENNLEQALVEPGWEGFFKISFPLWNPFYEHYLLYGSEDEANSQRFDVYNEGIFE